MGPGYANSVSCSSIVGQYEELYEVCTVQYCRQGLHCIALEGAPPLPACQSAFALQLDCEGYQAVCKGVRRLSHETYLIWPLISPAAGKR
jgi:hypothetical protein